MSMHGAHVSTETLNISERRGTARMGHHWRLDIMLNLNEYKELAGFSQVLI